MQMRGAIAFRPEHPWVQSVIDTKENNTALISYSAEYFRTVMPKAKGNVYFIIDFVLKEHLIVI